MSIRRAEREARQADAAFQMVLAYIGVATLEDALVAFDELDPRRIRQTVETWIDVMLALILTRRRLSRDLAMAYYRLVRALRTGRTIADPFDRNVRERVTLGYLRRQFRLLVEQHAPDVELPAATEGDDDEIPVDDIEGLRDLEVELEYEAEDAILDDLYEVAGLTPEQQAEVERALDELDKIKSASALAAERHALNGGRGSAYEYGKTDRLVIGWARVSLSGSPCGFCAMLISRGLEKKHVKMPKVELVAPGRTDWYHDNCRCMSVPVFSLSQYNTDPRFDQNRILSDMWRDRDNWENPSRKTLREWRRRIDAGYRNDDAPWVINPTEVPTPSPAPEAA